MCSYSMTWPWEDPVVRTQSCSKLPRHPHHRNSCMFTRSTIVSALGVISAAYARTCGNNCTPGTRAGCIGNLQAFHRLSDAQIANIIIPWRMIDDHAITLPTIDCPRWPKTAPFYCSCQSSLQACAMKYADKTPESSKWLTFIGLALLIPCLFFASIATLMVLNPSVSCSDIPDAHLRRRLQALAPLEMGTMHMSLAREGSSHTAGASLGRFALPPMSELAHHAPIVRSYGMGLKPGNACAAYGATRPAVSRSPAMHQHSAFEGGTGSYGASSTCKPTHQVRHTKSMLFVIASACFFFRTLVLLCNEVWVMKID